MIVLKRFAYTLHRYIRRRLALTDEDFDANEEMLREDYLRFIDVGNALRQPLYRQTYSSASVATVALCCI